MDYMLDKSDNLVDPWGKSGFFERSRKDITIPNGDRVGEELLEQTMGSRTGVVIGSGPTGGWTGAVLCETRKGDLVLCHLGESVSLTEVEADGAGTEAWLFLSRAMLGQYPLVRRTSGETTWEEERILENVSVDAILRIHVVEHALSDHETIPSLGINGYVYFTLIKQQNISGINEGASDGPEVPDVPKYKSESEEESWTFSQGDDDDDDNNEHDLEDEKDDEDDDDKNDSDETESDDDGDDFKVSTPLDHEFTEEEENQEGNDYVKEGEQEDEEQELYRDLNINLERRDAEMTNAQTNQDTEDVHVTLTTEPPLVQQQSSSVSSDLVLKYINPSPDIVFVVDVTPSSASIIPQPPVPIIQTLQQTPDSTTTTTIPTTTLPDIPNFASVFRFDQRVSALENEMSEFKQTNQFAKAVSSILAIIDNYLASKLKDVVDIDSNMKAIIKEQVKAQVSKIMPKVEKYITESLGAEILIDKMEENKSINRSDIQKNLYNALIESYNSEKDIISSYGKEAELSKEPTHKESKSISSSKGVSRSHPKSLRKSTEEEEHGQKVDDLEEQSHQKFNTGNDDATPVREVQDVNKRQWNPLSIQSSFNEFLATPIDFFAFIMNQLKIENLTQDVLTSPTYELMKGTCKSVVELEYHLEEVFKATNDQLDWHYLEGRQYPHDLSKPLPLILNARGCQTKAADYGHVKWIEDKGPKRQKFYGYAANMETSKDVYSRHMISTVTSLKIMQFFSYSYLEEIIVRRHDDQLYKFREGDFKRLHRQDIEDMLLLLVQGIIYQDDMDRNRLMRTEELHKFSDGTLNYVRTTLNDIATRIQMEYLPKKKWSKQDKQRDRVMINVINKKLRDRRLMRSLEKFVGVNPYKAPSSQEKGSRFEGLVTIAGYYERSSRKAAWVAYVLSQQALVPTGRLSNVPPGHIVLLLVAYSSSWLCHDSYWSLVVYFSSCLLFLVSVLRRFHDSSSVAKRNGRKEYMCLRQSSNNTGTEQQRFCDKWGVTKCHGRKENNICDGSVTANLCHCWQKVTAFYDRKVLVTVCRSDSFSDIFGQNFWSLMMVLG
ncbi:hypothetical protein Tco_0151353 [Tanacetum coccineum]